MLGVVAPLDEGTTLLLADPPLVAASIVARLPEPLCCCPPVGPTKKMDSKPQRCHRRASRRSAPRALLRWRAVDRTRELRFTANTAILLGEANSRRQPASGGCTDHQVSFIKGAARRGSPSMGLASSRQRELRESLVDGGADYTVPGARHKKRPGLSIGRLATQTAPLQEPMLYAWRNVSPRRTSRSRFGVSISWMPVTSAAGSGSVKARMVSKHWSSANKNRIFGRFSPAVASPLEKSVITTAARIQRLT